MTLKQLEAFYWAATCANFALAAERLHLSTSSLSKRIAELETALSVELFDRSSHKASLTEAGQALLPKATDLLHKAEELRQGVTTLDPLNGRCALGVGELSALTWLPRLATQLRHSAPALILEPQVDIGQLLEQRLHDGGLDCAVIAGRSAHEAIASHPVGTASFVWVSTPANAPRGGKLEGSLFAHQPLVTLPAGAGTTRILDDWLIQANCQPGQRFNCNSWGAIAGLLIDGFGVGILPEGWARAFARRGQLRILTSPVPLAPLAYTFRHRRKDERQLITTMHKTVKAAINFAVAPRLL